MASNECCSHWCHDCSRPVWPHGPNSLCPFCDGAFVAEFTSETHSAAQLGDLGTWIFYGHPRVDPRTRPAPIPALFEVLHPHHDHQRQHDVEADVLEAVLRLSVEDADRQQHDVEAEVLETVLGLSAEDEQPAAGPPPATGSAIRALPTVTVSEQHLASVEHCPVCQEKFELGTEAKQIPCDHIFHEDCIVPWLMLHNTCPVCRLQLPTADSSSSNSARNHGSRNPLFSLWPRRRSYQ